MLIGCKGKNFNYLSQKLQEFVAKCSANMKNENHHDFPNLTKIFIKSKMFLKF